MKVENKPNTADNPEAKEKKKLEVNAKKNLKKVVVGSDDLYDPNKIQEAG